MKRILLVDDNRVNKALVEKALSDHYEIQTSSTGEEALSLLESEECELVILDVIMPGMDGYEVLARIRSSERHRDLPVIFLTGRNTPEDVQKGLVAGANDYLPKPFSLLELKARVDSQIRLQEMSRILAGIERLKTAKGIAVTLRHEIVNILANISALNHILVLRKGTEEEENRRIEENIGRIKDILDRLDSLEEAVFEPYTPSAPEDMLKI